MSALKAVRGFGIAGAVSCGALLIAPRLAAASGELHCVTLEIEASGRGGKDKDPKDPKDPKDSPKKEEAKDKDAGPKEAKEKKDDREGLDDPNIAPIADKLKRGAFKHFRAFRLLQKHESDVTLAEREELKV